MFYFVKYTPIMLGDYQYPGWGEALGFMISGSSMIWVPGMNMNPSSETDKIFINQDI